MRTHTGEKPAWCSWAGCDYAASDHSNLARHVKAHLGERPFPCPEPGCTYAASQNGTLASHKRRRHTARSRVFPCMGAGCEYLAMQLGDLRSHAKRCKRPGAAGDDFIWDVNLLPRLDCVESDSLAAEASISLVKLQSLHAEEAAVQAGPAVQQEEQQPPPPVVIVATVTACL